MSFEGGSARGKGGVRRGEGGGGGGGGGGELESPFSSAGIFNFYLFLRISSINPMNIIFVSVPTLSSFPDLSFTKWLLRVGGMMLNL